MRRFKVGRYAYGGQWEGSANRRGIGLFHLSEPLLPLFLPLEDEFGLGMRPGIVLGGSIDTRAFESVAAALVGIASAWGWSHAIKNRRLVLPEVIDRYAWQLKNRVMAEPITALVTLPFAFGGPISWEVAWLSYPLVVSLSCPSFVFRDSLCQR